jgi:predicted Zn-dependent protease
MVARIAVFALAMIAVAWLGLSYRNSRLEHDAQLVAVQKAPPRAQIDRALSDLRSAEALNPDHSTGDATRVALHVRAGRLDLARADLERLVDREPENAEAWVLLASLTQRSDPARSAQARARLRQLNPYETTRAR